LNQLPQAETSLLPGATRSVQTGNCGGSACTRWGDYSAMSVDPVDDCTFWYANMYFPVQGTNWVTRIGSFKFPSCGASPTLTNTTISLISAPNPSTFGQAAMFTATVAISGGGAGTPSGTVTFFDGGSSLGTGSLAASGLATITLASLSVGAHNAITATYGGDANFAGSTSSAYLHTVNKANTSTGMTSAPNPSLVGQTVTFTATVSASGAVTPTGAITFTIDGSTAGVVALSGGRATFSTSALITGTHPVTVTYGGSGNFNGSLGTLPGGQGVIDVSYVYLPLVIQQ
jgi:hypothetical protein